MCVCEGQRQMLMAKVESIGGGKDRGQRYGSRKISPLMWEGLLIRKTIPLIVGAYKAHSRSCCNSLATTPLNQCVRSPPPRGIWSPPPARSKGTPYAPGKKIQMLNMDVFRFSGSPVLFFCSCLDLTCVSAAGVRSVDSFFLGGGVGVLFILELKC